MESFQQPHGYLRPPQPPPHPADPHHHQFHHPPRQPAPPQGSWFSNQFQYQPSHTPSPPPQWAPPPPPPPPQSDHFPTASYPPPSNAYPPPHSYHNQFPPPPPPPQFPPHSHIPQPYHQEWSTPSWPTNQGWDYSGHKNEEDWAARARAWADAKAAMETQHSQSQFAPAGRLQEQSHYLDQYQQSVDSRYADIQNQSHPSSSYQQIPVSDVSLQRVPGHSQEAVSVNSDTSCISDGHLPYSARDGTATGDSTVAYHQGSLPMNPSVHQQEVSSSYSSVTGKENANQNQQSYTMLPSTSSSQEQLHHLPPPAPMQPHFASSSHSMDPTISLADQPLDFAPRFNRDNDLQMQPTFAHHDPASMNNWGTPVVPGVGYPPIPPVLASGPQHDPSISTHSPVPGQVAPPFGRFPGPGISPPIPPAPFALSAGTTLNPTAAFSADAYGISGVPERPKKASVPNWLREEIKKTVIAGPSADHHKDDPKFIDNDSDKSYVKGDEPDSKSIDSSKSAEEEEDDEDYVEAAKTAAINQEIKRVLTEVLLKVTDELFDEIATKVLNEDDLTDEVTVSQNVVNSDHQTSASPPSGAIPKASAKILVPLKVKESENGAASEKSSSSSPGDVLGLGNYASDADDGDDEIESSSIPFPTKDAASQSGNKKALEDMHTSSQLKLEEDGRRQTDLVNNLAKTNSVKSKASNGAATDQLHDHKANKEVDHVHVSKVVSEDRDHELNTREKRHDKSNGSSSKDTSGMMTSKQPGMITGAEKTMEDHPGRENRTKADKTDRREKSSEKDSLKEVQGSKARADEKDSENHKRKDERHHKKEKADDVNEAKEGLKEHNVRPGERLKESESRKRSSQSDGKDDRKESEKAYKVSSVDDTRRRNEHTKDKGEHRLRHKDASNSDKHGRRRSPSISSRGKSKRDHAANHASDSSDGSDGSKRKRHSRKRDLSPSPVRSRRRQVSRSPHSKHSQRRHSPYSSLDNTRGRRSRSRSPVRRQR